MNKTEAIAIFGNRADMAEAMDITVQAISGWPKKLRPKTVDRVIAAAYRSGKLDQLPKRFQVATQQSKAA